MEEVKKTEVTESENTHNDNSAQRPPVFTVYVEEIAIHCFMKTSCKWANLTEEGNGTVLFQCTKRGPCRYVGNFISRPSLYLEGEGARVVLQAKKKIARKAAKQKKSPPGEQ
jgi:hypothetical protein